MPVDHFALPRWKSVQAASEQWYKIVQVLGAGGNGVAFLVMCTTPPRKGDLVALKVFRRLSKPERRDAFLGEVEFLQECDHPSILKVYDRGEYQRAGVNGDSFPFVVSEYLPRTLRHVIRTRSAGLVTKLSYTLQLLSALAFLESLETPIVHRDIKPENIFIKGGSCVLGDFGLLKKLDTDEEQSDDVEIVKTSIGAGMPYFYRTPDLVEYLNGTAALSTKSDVFQLGLVLAELFTGRNPHVRAERFADPVELESLGSIGGRFSGGIAAQLERMLAIAPGDRPTASELIDGWEGIFRDAVDAACDIDGYAF